MPRLCTTRPHRDSIEDLGSRLIAKLFRLKEDSEHLRGSRCKALRPWWRALAEHDTEQSPSRVCQPCLLFHLDRASSPQSQRAILGKTNKQVRAKLHDEHLGGATETPGFEARLHPQSLN